MCFVLSVEGSPVEVSVWPDMNWLDEGQKVGHFFALFYFAAPAGVYWAIFRLRWASSTGWHGMS